MIGFYRFEGFSRTLFAIDFIVLFALMFAIMEVSLIYFGGVSLENGMMEAARQVRTGQLQIAGGSQADFETVICDYAEPIIDCASGLYVDVYRAIVDIDHLMNYAKTTVREMEIFGVEPDQYTLQMAIHLKEGTESLQEGFKKLSENAALAETNALAARKAERTVEKTYRKALAELFDISLYVANIRERKARRNEKVEAEILALEHVMETFKRREIYRHLSNAADRLAHAGATLHDIVVKIA